MAPSIGVNLRVTGHCSQGGRKHMEDMFSVAYQQTEDEKDLEYAFFGIFDGHGGREAAKFAKDHLMDFIVNQKTFWSDSDEDIKKAIKDGFLQTHYAMWHDLESWPKTASGLPSTAGTTASIAFIRRGKIYIGHVGDSQIILGYQKEGEVGWEGVPLTREHKPECKDEIERIEKSGGKVISKQGVPRVVWNRPCVGHKGPVRRSTHIDEIPFLAVARSLGDLWSYNSDRNEFVVSPEPDVEVHKIEVGVHKCLIFGTDGLWNMMTPMLAAGTVYNAEKHNEKYILRLDSDTLNHQQWINPSKRLVDVALGIWNATHLRADNTSAVTLMLDPQGPPRAQVLRNKLSGQHNTATSNNGCMAVFTRYRDKHPSTTSIPKTPTSDSVQINEVSSSAECMKVGDNVNGYPFVKKTTHVKSDEEKATPKLQDLKVKENSTLVPKVLKRVHGDNAPSRPPPVLCLKRKGESTPSALPFKRWAGTEEEDTSDAENKRVTWNKNIVDSTMLGGSQTTNVEQRTLRSSTATASPIRTLRSRNVGVVGRVNKVKVRRSLPVSNTKIKPNVAVSRRSLPGKHKEQPTLILSTRLRKR